MKWKGEGFQAETQRDCWQDDSDGICDKWLAVTQEKTEALLEEAT